MRYAALTLIALAAPAAAQPGWTGRYAFTEDGGRTAGGSAIIVERTLTIAPGRCRLAAQGFQIDETIRCTAAATRDGLTVAFASYDDGRVVNVYGVAVYRPGQTLFTLVRSKRGLLTRWGAYGPDKPPPRPVPGFRRVNPR